MVTAAVKPFAVEQWMDKYEMSARYNIAESCAASISLDDLQNLSSQQDIKLFPPTAQKLTYGHIRGSPSLRRNIAGLYCTGQAKGLDLENVLVMAGAISANLSVFYALIEKGQHTIVHYPTYQQLYEVPTSLGANVTLWRTEADDKWGLDIQRLKKLLREDTKLIVIKYICTQSDGDIVLSAQSNPNNPTGAVIPKETLEALIDIARERKITLMSDEAYRPLFHSATPNSPNYPPSLLDFQYENIVVTGSMSKAYSLAGIRIGWIASRSNDIIGACSQARDYTTISVSQLDDQVATFALGEHCVHNLLQRNNKLASFNLAVLDKFIADHNEQCSYVKPVGGSTVFVKFSRNGTPLDDLALCEYLVTKLGVFISPGCLCFGNGNDFKGYTRVGFCCETQVLEDALKVLGRFLNSEEYQNLPLAE